MKQQLPLFACELPATAQRTILEALALLESQLREPGAAFTSSHAVRDWLRLQLATLDREAFIVLWLDNQHRLIADDMLFLGTINSISVHPREVVKAGLKHNAAAAVLAHNHPSGHSEPSAADRRITELNRHWTWWISACWTIWWLAEWMLSRLPNAAGYKESAMNESHQ